MLNLPESIVNKLNSALSQLPKGQSAKVRKTTFEGALNHTLFIETESDRYVFRTRRESSAEEIEEYMRYMYEVMGLFGVGGIFKLRTIAEEIQFMENALAFSLPVPQIICSDRDWIVMEFIQGKTLHESVKKGDIETVFAVLQEMNLAHQHGIIYGDRWGDNELIDDRGNVRLIDFDIEWDYQGSETGVLEALEMAVTLFNSLRLTVVREEFLHFVKSKIVPWLQSSGYDLQKIAMFVEGLGNFYLDPAKPRNIWSLPPSLYLTLKEPRDRLVALLTKV
ncbi:MAG: RIO1 family regulatory kinase/ATPase [Cyanobacteria bacterium P01_E01_bin.42]